MLRSCTLLAILVGMLVAGTAQAAPRYTTDWVGSICRETADQIVVKGLATRAAPQNYVLDKTVRSFRDENFTYCRATFFGRNTVSADIRAEVQVLLHRRCRDQGGMIFPFSYAPRPRADRSPYPHEGFAFFCMSDEHRALFFFTHETTSLNVAEPNSPDAAFSSDYQAFMRAHGFMTENEERSRRSAAEQRQREADREAAQQAQERVALRPRKSQIGTKLCRREGHVIFQGFVEGRSPDNEKIQIRVAAAYLENITRLDQRGPGPEIIWSHPDEWELCE